MASANDSHGLTEESADLVDDAVRLRRKLHAHPEIGLDLPRTRDTICEQIDNLGITVTHGISSTSVVGLLEGSRPGPTILLRADMDALPMPEDTGVEFSSTVEGVMHACGHDLHVAMLVGAARLLSARQNDFAGRVLFMFQPGEEGHGGAQHMIDEGLFNVPNLSSGEASPVTGAFAIHATPNLPGSVFALKGGTMMASADVLTIVVTGRGGHGSAPHNALDPVPVACEIALALQTMITRTIDVFDPAVVSVTQIMAGTTNNVIPETATIVGTIRAVSERTRTKVHDGIRRVAEGIAAAHDAHVSVDVAHGYPVTVNDPGYAQFVTSVAKGVVGDRSVVAMPNPVMGAEDFSYVLHNVAGAMAFLGCSPAGVDPFSAAPNHSNRVYFDEAPMAVGMAMYASVALAHLSAAEV